MKLEYIDGRVSFDASDLFEHMEPEQKRSIVDTLACESDVIDFVAQQIIDKWTELGSHGFTGVAVVEPYRGLDKAWRDVAKASGDIAKREIVRLEKSLEASEDRERTLGAESQRLIDLCLARLKEAHEAVQAEIARLQETQDGEQPPSAALRVAAQAVIDRWETPIWKDVPATAVYIYALRDALNALPQPADKDGER